MVLAVIIGILFFLFAAAGIAVAVLMKKQRQSVLKWIGAGVGIAFGALFLFIPFSIHTVDTGEVAVVKHLGKATAVRTPGTYFDFWITNSYSKYDLKVQEVALEDMDGFRRNFPESILQRKAF